MEYTDALSKHYSKILEGSYDCIDRLVLRAYNPILHSPGGLRVWYRRLSGDDKRLDTNQLMRFAGRFSRRVKAFAKSKSIPVIHFKSKERKSDISKELLPKARSFTGIFAIFINRAPALLWEVKKFDSGSIDIRRKKSYSLVNYYSFHIMDKKWGHIIIRISSHPPFSCLIILNGHEWVERRNSLKKLSVIKEDNCFTSYSDGEALSKVADALKDKGRLEEVCNRWVYGCLWFGIDFEEQERTDFRYQYSIFQAEYSRNLLFHRGRVLDDVYQNIIDLTRKALDIKRLKSIFGRKLRPYNRKTNTSGFEVRIEKPDYNLTVFKIHFGKLTLKLYDKGERTLRAEVVVHNTKDLKCKRSLACFHEIVDELHLLMNSFMNNLKYTHIALIKDGSLEELTSPTKKGKTRLAGININQKRSLTAMETVLELAVKPYGFTVKDVARIMKEKSDATYTARKASYDLRKLRGKSLVEKQKGKNTYIATEKGIQNMSIVLSLIKEQIPKSLAILNSDIEKKKELDKVEQHYFNIRNEISALREKYGIKLAA